MNLGVNVYFLTVIICVTMIRGSHVCRRGELVHHTVSCDKFHRDCPNTYRCKVAQNNCCQYRKVPQCNPLIDNSTQAPYKCRGGGSITCPQGYYCYTDPKGLRYNMCCLDVTCIDNNGNMHKPADGKWLHEDGCNKCLCSNSGTISCSNKAKCALRCNEEDGVFWKAGCIRCECKNKRLNCLGVCERSLEETEYTPFSPCPEGCGKQAQVKRCNALNEAGAECSMHGLNWNTCNKVQCTTPGVRLTESTSIIIGGKEVSPKNNYRWMVYIDLLDDCRGGGTLISPRHILTSAHLISNKKFVRIKTGKHRISAEEPFEQERLVSSSSFKIHPNFDRITLNNDIAIIVLNEPIQMNNVTQPALLPPDNTFEIKRLACVITGWGDTEGSGSKSCSQRLYSDVLLRTWINDHDQCEGLSDEPVSDKMFCAHAEGHDSCYGDTGGPLQCRRKAHWTVYGITSWGARTCGTGSGVYTKVTEYIDWIQDTIKVDGNWGEWSPFTACSATCDIGKKSRVRVCTDPAPIGAGICPGFTHTDEDGTMAQVQETPCFVTPC
ncbi:unnamed protein product [Owenia fusiformis]|uniref:Uncharacterized protein n=1 Tax=Owenia fusiformis TaxID=6347 RepID=A0A8J1TT10_OWEFU|nr:unnamed protein product [Owenia fusiformis]